MRKKSYTFLEKYLNANAPVGFETTGQKIWMEYVKDYADEFITDTYGSVAAIINPNKKYKVVIEAHADEISWFVNYISPEGYIFVRRNGGSDHQIAPSMRVDVHGEKGIIKGVFGWPAIHVRTPGKEAAPSMKNIFVDVGATKAEEVAEMGIHVGTVITFEATTMRLGKKFITGRALDNRAGGFMIAEVARKIKENKDRLPFSLYVVNAVQEEVGLRGAEMISRRIKPNVAIVTDVTHDTTSPPYDRKEQGEQVCGKGPVLTYGPAVHNVLLNKIIKVAEQNKISFQRAAASRFTGTDTDAFAYSDIGLPSALISLPLKYMHTTVETAHEDDIEKVIDLIYHSVINIKENEEFSYF